VKDQKTSASPTSASSSALSSALPAPAAFGGAAASSHNSSGGSSSSSGGGGRPLQALDTEAEVDPDAIREKNLPPLPNDRQTYSVFITNLELDVTEQGNASPAPLHRLLFSL
jgi:hypothetical protein